MSEEDWIADGMPDLFDGLDMRGRKVWLAWLAEHPCGLTLSGPLGEPRLRRTVEGREYSWMPHGEPGEYQFPICPHPECRSLIPCRQDLPGGAGPCLCHACTVAPLRDGDGTIRLEMVSLGWHPLATRKQKKGR
jgi:hypothetical protein